MDCLELIGRKWMPIPEFEGYYASDDGSVLSVVRGMDNPRILKQVEAKDGHRYVFLYNNKKQTKVFVHRAVLMAWVGLPQSGQEGRHLNDTPWDNRLENLAWGTRMENVEDKRRNGGIPVGERTGSHKLTEEAVMQIRSRYAYGESSADLAGEFGVAKNTILTIVRGEKWKHLPVVPVKVKHSTRRKTPLSEEHIEIGTAALKKYAAQRKKIRQEIPCACGCGGTLVTPNDRGRDKKFIHGHNQRGKKWRWNHDNNKSGIL